MKDKNELIRIGSDSLNARRTNSTNAGIRWLLRRIWRFDLSIQMNITASVIEDEEISQDVKWIGDRIVGCQSTNHTACRGELWECERCHKIICWEEGSTDLPELCDDCWCDVRMPNGDYKDILILQRKVASKKPLTRSDLPS